jgi:hypothetical protein
MLNELSNELLVGAVTGDHRTLLVGAGDAERLR